MPHSVKIFPISAEVGDQIGRSKHLIKIERMVSDKVNEISWWFFRITENKFKYQQHSFETLLDIKPLSQKSISVRIYGST